MNKKYIIIAVIIAIIAIASIIFLQQKMICYEHKTDDGFVVKTRYEIIVDYFNDVHYEEIYVQ